jgi:hypothetical protein
MKNIFSFIFIFVLIALTFLFYDSKKLAFDFFTQGECEFVVSSANSNIDLPPEVKVVKNGTHYMITAPSSLSRFLYNRLVEVKGMTFYTTQSLQSVVERLNVKYFKGEEIEGARHYYGFCKSFSDFVFISGKKVNIHFVEKQNQLIIGLPIILGSY